MRIILVGPNAELEVDWPCVPRIGEQVDIPAGTTVDLGWLGQTTVSRIVGRVIAVTWLAAYCRVLLRTVDAEKQAMLDGSDLPERTDWNDHQ